MKAFHHTHHFSLPLTLPSPQVLYFRDTGDKNEDEIFNRKSVALWFFSVRKRTGCPSNNSSSRSDHGIICGINLKSFKNMTSQSSASSHVYLRFEGLENVSNMCCTGAKRIVFLQFEEPTRIMLHFLPLSLTSFYLYRITYSFSKGHRVNMVSIKYLKSTSYPLSVATFYAFLS